MTRHMAKTARVLAVRDLVRRTLVALAVLAALLGALTAFGSNPAHAADFTVTNTNDSGDGSLRQAILDANANLGADNIKFDIPGNGPHTIAPSSALPDVTEAVTIDGYTQSGSTENTLAQGTNAVLKIELNFANAGNKGLTIAANDNTVRGLVINRSGADGIALGGFGCTAGNNTVVEGNFIGTNPAGTAAGPGNGQLYGISICAKNNTIGGTTAASRNLISGNDGSAGIGINSNSWQPQGNRIEGNLIGTNAAGSSALPNFIGVYISAYAGGNTIGGTTAASRNVISGNSGDGVQSGGDGFNTTPGDTIQGNYIGTNVDGTAAVPNGENGLSITGVNNNNTIGGTAVGAGNVISGNGKDGLGIGSTGNTVQGNLIGLKADGSGSLGNGQPNFVGSGIQVGGNNNTIGGTEAGAGNTIANNGLVGVVLTDLNSEGNSILSNSIFSNTRLGIDLSEGGPLGVTVNDPGDGDNFVANRGQNFPVISSASVSGGNATLSGTLNSNPNSTFRLEFFANDACNADVPGSNPDEKYFGEGQTFIGTTDVTTDGSGNASFGPLSFPVPAGQTVFTATATNTTTNNTSEFSECRSPATNSPPTATDDSYSTNQDTALNQPAPGVLANDSDPENDSLTAIKVSDPSNGTLVLNSDGSFTYTPNAGYSGTDSFTYKAKDPSNAESNVATVTITVNPVDTTAPTVVSVDPRDGQTGVSPTTNITITFSEKMDESTLNDNTVKLVKLGRKATSIPVTMTKSTDGNGRTVLTLDPYGSTKQKLAAGTTYQLTIEGAGDTDGFAVKDLAGNELATDQVSKFTTAKK